MRESPAFLSHTVVADHPMIRSVFQVKGGAFAGVRGQWTALSGEALPRNSPERV